MRSDRVTSLAPKNQKSRFTPVKTQHSKKKETISDKKVHPNKAAKQHECAVVVSHVCDRITSTTCMNSE